MYDNLILLLSKLYPQGVRGLPRKVVEKCGMEVAKTIKFMNGSTEILEWLNEHGFHIILLTASPEEIAQPIALDLKIDETYGLCSEIKNDRYSGKCTRILAKEGKRNLLKKLINGSSFKIGVGDMWDDMDAYSDFDLRFLIGNGSIDLEKRKTGLLLIKDLQEIKFSLLMRKGIDSDVNQVALPAQFG